MFFKVQTVSDLGFVDFMIVRKHSIETILGILNLDLFWAIDRRPDPGPAITKVNDASCVAAFSGSCVSHTFKVGRAKLWRFAG